MDEEVISIKNFFRNKYILLTAVWIESFLEWCKQEHDLPVNYTEKQLQEKVYEQWLLQDLRTLEVCALPPNLAIEKSYILNGVYCLQLMKIVDISKPKLWQLQRIRNAVSKNTDPENDFGKRVLQLTLTDGVQEVEAMEFKPILSLNINLSPGLKIRLTGPVKIRRGRIMLESNHIKILGGEVEELSVVNAAENILARALSLPENPQPNIINENLLNINVLNDELECDPNFRQNNITNIPNNRTNNPPPHTLHAQSNINVNKPNQNNLVTHNNMVNKIVSHPIISEPEFPDDDFDDEILLEAERRLTNTENIRPVCKSTEDLFEDCELENIDWPLDSNITSNINPANVDKKLLHNVARETDTVSSIKKLDLDELIDISLVNDLNQSLSQPMQNIISISDLKKKKIISNQNKFSIKAKFLEVVEKLTVLDNEFHLVIKVCDMSGEIVLKVHSDVTSCFAECSPLELMGYREKILNQDPTAREKMLQVLGRIKSKLEELNDTMDIAIIEEGISFMLVKVKK